MLVETGIKLNVVDLVEKTCSCRNWDLTSILCMHAVAVIHLKDELPKTYVENGTARKPRLTFNPTYGSEGS